MKPSTRLPDLKMTDRPMNLPLGRKLFALTLCVASGLANATEVVLAGVFPGKAVLVINGRSPRAFAAGVTTSEGVRVISVDSESATVEYDGGRHRLIVGQQAVSVGNQSSSGSGRTVVIPADSRGHFYATGSINGASMNFMVDTGATLVSMGRSDALKAGIDFTKGEPGISQTANGSTRVWRVRLDSVRVGDVTLHNVDGVVHSSDLPFVLLGASFLNRMEMRRDGAALMLRQRY